MLRCSIVLRMLLLIAAGSVSASSLAAESGLAAESNAGPGPQGDRVRLNQIQVIGTHNSYHLAPLPAVMQQIAARGEGLARSLDYTHRPLPEQFSALGIRQIELDVFADPAGGKYAEPRAAKNTPGVEPPHDPQGVLQQPGLKVFHFQDIDYRSTVLTFVDALQQVRQWLQQHPRAVPIMVLIEAKDTSVGPLFTVPHRFGAAELDSIDAEILSVFQADEIIKPDDVRGSHETLRDAIAQQGWPRLDEVRGKVIFALDNGGRIRDGYLEGHPSLRGRLLFVSVDADHEAAAFMKLNDPGGSFEAIQRAVKQGFIVRTRADSETRQSRQNDVTQRDQALASGAQYVSTDYPEPDPRFSDYSVQLPGGVVARPNPLTGADLKRQELDGVGRTKTDP